MSQAKSGDEVKVHYKGTLEDGTVFDSTEGREPLGFTLGSGQLIPGFDQAVAGMAVGDKKSINIPCAQAYGERNEDLVIQAPLNQVPPDIKPEVGMKLQMGAPNGEVIAVEVTEVTDEHVILDANPPLAGKDLNFDIELVSIG